MSALVRSSARTLDGTALSTSVSPMLVDSGACGSGGLGCPRVGRRGDGRGGTWPPPGAATSLVPRISCRVACISVASAYLTRSMYSFSPSTGVSTASMSDDILLMCEPKSVTTTTPALGMPLTAPSLDLISVRMAATSSIGRCSGRSTARTI